jgi:hypothetical protein
MVIRFSAIIAIGARLIDRPTASELTIGPEAFWQSNVNMTSPFVADSTGFRPKIRK